VIDSICQACLELAEKSIYAGTETATSGKQELEQELKTLGLALFQALFRAECDDFRQTVMDSDEVTTVIFQVDRDLAYLPIEVIYDGERFLALHIPTGRRLFAHEVQGEQLVPDKPCSVLIVGDPTNDPSIRTDVEYEIDTLRSIFRSKKARLRIATGSRVDEKYLLSYLPNSTIFHFTGHGLISDDARQAGMEIARDSVITGESISGLQHPPQIVFLNMCTASWPDAWKSSVGLVDTFLKRGTRCCIATLWDIRSRTAALLSSNFYRYLLEGSSIGEALRLARLEVVGQCGIGDLTWASYALYGDPKTYLQTLVRGPSRYRVSWKSLLIAALLITGGILLPQRISKEEHQTRSNAIGYIVASSHPQGATILLDGEPVGVTPSAIEVSPGNHQIIIAKDGYRRWEAWVEVTRTKRTTIEAILKELE